jgi:cyclic-di-GMP-binding protein
MASNHSFDIVSKIDMQEVDNAVNMANKELSTRYDLKDSKSEIELVKAEQRIDLTSSDEYKIVAVYDILRQKLIKRQISVKSLSPGKIEDSHGGTAKQKIDLHVGIDKEKAKKIVKDIKDAKAKVTPAIMDDQIRVTGKKLDELQAVMQLIKSNDYDIHLQFENYR